MTLGLVFLDSSDCFQVVLFAAPVPFGSRSHLMILLCPFMGSIALQTRKSSLQERSRDRLAKPARLVAVRGLARSNGAHLQTMQNVSQYFLEGEGVES